MQGVKEMGVQYEGKGEDAVVESNESLVLLVDDDKLILDLLSSWLEATGFAHVSSKQIHRPVPNKILLRPNDVALFLGVSLKTVYRWYHLGEIKGTKITGPYESTGTRSCEC